MSMEQPRHGIPISDGFDFSFEPGHSYIRLNNLTGECKRGLTVGFDAIWWVKVA